MALKLPVEAQLTTRTNNNLRVRVESQVIQAHCVRHVGIRRPEFSAILNWTLREDNTFGPPF